jgi:hypothetical protein
MGEPFEHRRKSLPCLISNEPQKASRARFYLSTGSKKALQIIAFQATFRGPGIRGNEVDEAADGRDFNPFTNNNRLKSFSIIASIRSSHIDLSLGHSSLNLNTIPIGSLLILR